MSGYKNDGEKADLSLLCFESLEGAARARMEGNRKYGAFNYQGGMTHRRVLAAALRHIGQHLRGEDLDAETGLRHIDHAEAEINMLGWLIRHRPDLDDRPNGKGGFVSPTAPDTVHGLAREGERAAAIARYREDVFKAELAGVQTILATLHISDPQWKKFSEQEKLLKELCLPLVARAS